MKKLFFLITVFLSVLSCEESLQPLRENKLVVEGWIESDGYPVVLLTLTASPEVAEDINLADYVAKFAKITLSDGDTTVVLTGSVDRKYYPPMVFKTYDIKGVAGKTYYLTAQYNGLEVSAETKILEPYEIKDVKTVAVDDTARIFDVEIQDGVSPGGKIMFFSRVWNTETRLFPSLFGIYEVEENKKTYTVYHSKESPNFSAGDSVSIHLCRLDDFQFRFWQAYSNAVNFGGGFVISTDKSLPSNIEGGYGYFFGYGASKVGIVAE
ncbi:MAG: DUF4249 domain-containing protein [Bacteroidales bacterium]|nr:DUF4249 domain-containing protein [Bacteroidales bacterium]